MSWYTDYKERNRDLTEQGYHVINYLEPQHTGEKLKEAKPAAPREFSFDRVVNLKDAVRLFNNRSKAKKELVYNEPQDMLALGLYLEQMRKEKQKLCLLSWQECKMIKVTKEHVVKYLEKN